MVNTSVQEGGAPKQHTHYGGEGRALHRAEVLPAKYVVLASACFGFLLVACIFSRFVGVLVLVFSVLVQIAFFCLCSCKDQAIVRHRPHSRKKRVLVLVSCAPKWNKGVKRVGREHHESELLQ